MERLKHFPKQVKIEALRRIWGGEKVTNVARDYGISRQMIYTWKKKAEVALFQALEEGRKGPKLQRKTQKPLAGKIHQEVRKLSVKVERIYRKIEAFEKENNLSEQNNKKPQRCPICGCHKVYKNGTYIKKSGNNNSKKGQVVQRYVCAWCKSTIH